MQLQLEFFPKDPLDEMRDDIKAMKTTLDKMRKALFARHGELAKMYLDLSHDHEILLNQLANYEKNRRNLWKRRMKKISTSQIA